MGQICPRSVPSLQYAPTPTLQCQGISTAKIAAEKVRLQSSQSSMESKVISRGASCTQDDIRRSLRKEKEKSAASPNHSSKADSVKQGDKDLNQLQCDPHNKISETHQQQKRKDKRRNSGRQSAQILPTNHGGEDRECNQHDDVSKTNHQRKRPKDKRDKHRHYSRDSTQMMKTHHDEEERDLDQHHFDPSEDISRTKHHQKRQDKSRHSGRQSKETKNVQHKEESSVLNQDKLCDPHEDGSRTNHRQKRQQERQSKHRHSANQPTFNDNKAQNKEENKGKDIKGHRHKHHRAKGQNENVKIEQEDFEEGVLDEDFLKANRYFMSPNTHEIVMKGSLLEIQVTENTDEGHHQRHGHHHRQSQRHHHRHRHRKSSSDRNQNPVDTIDGKRRTPEKALTPTSVTQVECSTQNAHNAKISARKTHPPNSQPVAASSSSIRRSRRDKVRAEDAPLSKPSSKEMRTKDKTVRDNPLNVMDPVYSLPPLLQ